MITTPLRIPLRRMRGVGLVELMVTMLIGAMLTAGVIALFNANRQSFRLQDNLSVAQESGSFALDFLTRDLRLAGYPGGLTPTPGFDVANSIDNRVENLNQSINGATVSVSFTDDQLAIVHQADARVGAVTCTGVNVDPANTGTVVISNRYWVQTSADGTERELVCQGFILGFTNSAITSRTAVGTPQALISGVDSFQVLYGIDTTHDRNATVSGATCAQSADLPNEWVTASQLAAAIALGAAEPATCAEMDPRTVVRAVRIGLLVRTTADVDAIPLPNQSYTVLDRTLTQATFPPITDGRVRRLFMSTVALRNSAGATEQ